MGRGALPTSLVQALLLLAWSRIRQKGRQRQVVGPVELYALHLDRNKPKFRQRIERSHVIQSCFVSTQAGPSYGLFSIVSTFWTSWKTLKALRCCRTSRERWGTDLGRLTEEHFAGVALCDGDVQALEAQQPARRLPCLQVRELL